MQISQFKNHFSIYLEVKCLMLAGKLVSIRSKYSAIAPNVSSSKNLRCLRLRWHLWKHFFQNLSLIFLIKDNQVGILQIGFLAYTGNFIVSDPSRSFL